MQGKVSAIETSTIWRKKMQEQYEIVVIGAGPAGYVCAIRLAQAGKKVALIDRSYIGGTCLNVGCIPTKTLLTHTDILHKIKAASTFGITTGEVKVDFPAMKERKDRVVEQIRKNLEFLLKSNQIQILQGEARFLSSHCLQVKNGENHKEIGFQKAVIATGSAPVDIPAFPVDHRYILNSTSLLNNSTLFKKLVIVGGGYIGCEFASLYAELGTSVTIVESLNQIVAAQGQTISEALTAAFKKQNIEILTGKTVEKILTPPQSGQPEVLLTTGEKIACDAVLISVGRKAVSQELDVQKAGLSCSPKGEIAVDEHMRTSVANIYAIGDVTGKSMLAHVASHQAMVAADTILGKSSSMHYESVPAVIFTSPQIATVGLTPEEAQKLYTDVVISKFPFQALGKAVASQETQGFAQLVTRTSTGQIVGAQVVGPEASVLIGEITLAIANELSLECVAQTIHAHPTLSEAWPEVALLAQGFPLHLPPKKKV